MGWVALIDSMTDSVRDMTRALKEWNNPDNMSWLKEMWTTTKVLKEWWDGKHTVVRDAPGAIGGDTSSTEYKDTPAVLQYKRMVRNQLRGESQWDRDRGLRDQLDKQKVAWEEFLQFLELNFGMQEKLYEE